MWAKWIKLGRFEWEVWCFSFQVGVSPLCPCLRTKCLFFSWGHPRLSTKHTVAARERALQDREHKKCWCRGVPTCASTAPIVLFHVGNGPATHASSDGSGGEYSTDHRLWRCGVGFLCSPGSLRRMRTCAVSCRVWWWQWRAWAVNSPEG